MEVHGPSVDPDGGACIVAEDLSVVEYMQFMKTKRLATAKGREAYRLSCRRHKLRARYKGFELFKEMANTAEKLELLIDIAAKL